MSNMNFNPYGFIAPQNKQDYIALLDEAIRMAEELGSMWDQFFSEVQNNSSQAAI